MVFANTRIQSPAGVTGGGIPFKFDFDGSDYGFTGDLTVQKITPITDGTIDTESITFTKNVILHNLEVVAFKITGDNSASLKPEKRTNLVIFPNPVKNSFKINYNNKDLVSVKLYNTLGRLVLDRLPNDKIVDISMLSDGFYMVLIQTKNKEFIAKLIKK